MNIFSLSKKIGDRLYSQWRNECFDIDTFPALAYQVITTFKLDQEINIFDIPYELLSIQELPQQRINHGSSFGQPPLTLYVSEDNKFFIEIYLWSSVDMTIHDHPFSGAFAIIEGYCRHDTYIFDEIGGARQLQTGILTKKKSEILTKGDCRKIYNGGRFIHRNLHLSKPTVTFIIRTFKEPGFTGFIFEESGLAILPDLTQRESKFIDYLEGVLRLKNYDAAYEMIRYLTESDAGDYAKYRSAEIYLDTTHHYNEIDLLSGILSSCIQNVSIDILRNTFLLKKIRHLNNKYRHINHY